VGKRDLAGNPRRIAKYVITRLITRGGDAIILFLYWKNYGEAGLVQGYAVSSLYDYFFDFLLEKFWVFEEELTTWKILLKEVTLYAGARLANSFITGLLGGSVYLLGVPPLVILGVGIPLFWTLEFIYFRWIFSNQLSLKDLFIRAFETCKTAVWKRAHSDE
jgi:putative flippase GtrA